MFNKKANLVETLLPKKSQSHKTRNALIMGGSVVAAILVGAAAKKQDRQ
jgi:hypothetical protein